MPERLVDPNLRHFPSSRKRAITGLEAAEEEEADKQLQQQLAAVAAEADRVQDKYRKRVEESTAMIAEYWHQSQSQLSFLQESPKENSSSNPSSEDESFPSSSEADNTKVLDHDIFDEDREPRCSGCVRCPTRDIALQMLQDAKLAKAKGRKKQAKRKGQARAISISQLIEEFNLESE
jgi:hypothetical protein